MKKIVLILGVLGMISFSGCTGPQGPPGYPGQNGVNISSEVFELDNVNFTNDPKLGYIYSYSLNPNILATDDVLIYRLTGTIDSNTPIWQLLPNTLSLPQGQLTYDYDFSKIDFYIYAGGNYDLSTSPTYINNQTFRIVVIPGYFSNKNAGVDFNDYNAVIKAYGLDDKHIKILNSK